MYNLTPLMNNVQAYTWLACWNIRKLTIVSQKQNKKTKVPLVRWASDLRMSVMKLIAEISASKSSRTWVATTTAQVEDGAVWLAVSSSGFSLRVLFFCIFLHLFIYILLSFLLYQHFEPLHGHEFKSCHCCTIADIFWTFWDHSGGPL